ncbi:MAG: hypothetical protein VX663_05875 [Pseudomonadota bacterium]|nr:hypothetical protein [Pseudomonadota bacterium]
MAIKTTHRQQSTGDESVNHTEFSNRSAGKSAEPRVTTGATLPPVAVLHSALLFLMSRYARTGCIHLVEPIVQHLRLLESHPDIGDTDGPLQRTCRQLAGDWTELRYLRQLQTTPPDRLPATRH